MGIQAIDPAYVGLGANLGEPRAQLEWALARLAELDFVAGVRASPFYATSPLGADPGQPWFVNGVAELTLVVAPEVHKLLDALLAIEATAGRDRKNETKAGPRVLDLDLLVWGARREENERLTLPHPRIGGRAFVLAPLADLVGLDFHLPRPAFLPAETGDFAPRGARIGELLAAALADPAQRLTKLV